VAWRDGVLGAWAVRLREGRDPRQARYLTAESLRWMLAHRAFTPGYLVRYARLAAFRLRNPHVVLEGMVFLGRRARLEARPGYGRLVVGPWVHVGELTRIRAHEGTLTVGDRVVFGRDASVNCYLDVEIGSATMVADWAYITDFDHVTQPDGPSDHRPIKDLGLAKSPVRIGPGSWLGVRATVLRGTVLGPGTVVAAHAVARGHYPPYAVVAGVPGRAVRSRAEAVELARDTRRGSRVAPTRRRAADVSSVTRSSPGGPG
jgi:acetyltransferase-like isoleucine patch superfamily enzyme